MEQLWSQVAFLGHSCSRGVLEASEVLPGLGDSCDVQASSAWEMLDHGARSGTESSVMCRDVGRRMLIWARSFSKDRSLCPASALRLKRPGSELSLKTALARQTGPGQEDAGVCTTFSFDAHHPKRGTLGSKAMQMVAVGMPAGERILQQLLRSKTVSLSQPRQSKAQAVMAVWCGNNHRPLASSSFP